MPPILEPTGCPLGNLTLELSLAGANLRGAMTIAKAAQHSDALKAAGDQLRALMR